MPIMPWQETFNIGIEQFDIHHKQLVGLLNSYYDALKEGASDEKLGKLLNGLIDYAAYHFAAEEEWMDVNECFKSVGHREQHVFFIKMKCPVNNGHAYLKRPLCDNIGETLTPPVYTVGRGGPEPWQLRF